MNIHIEVPNEELNDSTKGRTTSGPNILVVGVGGGGCNAVNNMIEKQLEGVTFLACNTDMQALEQSKADHVMQLGPDVTGGLGAGSRADVGRQSAEESMPQLMQYLESSHMVFIAAGMGGGTGTGAAPVIARAAREAGCLTVGVVTKPFQFEGVRRARAAEEGICEFSQHVDSLIVIPNQNLFRIAKADTTYAESFRMVDEVLYQGVRGVTDLIVRPGQINLDFNDIRNVMQEMGRAMMGTGEAEGDGRAQAAAELAIDNPLLESSSMRGARSILINITSGEDLMIHEVDEVFGRICDEVGDEVDITHGSAFDPSLNGRIRVSLIATGIAEESEHDGDTESASNERRVRAPTPIRVFTPAAAPKVTPMGGAVAGSASGSASGSVGSTGNAGIAPAASGSSAKTANTASAAGVPTGVPTGSPRVATATTGGVATPLASRSVGAPVMRSGAATATAAALAIEPEPQAEAEAEAEAKEAEVKAVVSAPTLKAVPTPKPELKSEPNPEPNPGPKPTESVASSGPAMASPAAMPTTPAEPAKAETPQAATPQAATPQVAEMAETAKAAAPAPFVPPEPQETRSAASSVAVRVAQANEEKKQIATPASASSSGAATASVASSAPTAPTASVATPTATSTASVAPPMAVPAPTASPAPTVKSETTEAKTEANPEAKPEAKPEDKAAVKAPSPESSEETRFWDRLRRERVSNWKASTLR